MKMGFLKNLYYTFLLFLLLLVMVYCTGGIMKCLDNLADSVAYASDGSMRVIFTDFNGD